MNLSESIDFYCPWNYQTLSYRKQSIAENLWLFDDFRGNRSEIRRQSLISERWARDAYQRKGCFKTVVFLRQESEEGRQWLSSLSNSIFSLWARYWFHIGSNYFDDKSNRSIGMGLLTYIDSNAILFMEQDGSCCLRNHQGDIQLLSRRNRFADKPFKRLREEWLNHVQVTRLFGIRNFWFFRSHQKTFYFITEYCAKKSFIDYRFATISDKVGYWTFNVSRTAKSNMKSFSSVCTSVPQSSQVWIISFF